MTIIVYRNGVLASSKPLHRAKDGSVFAVTGDPEECAKLIYNFEQVGMPSVMPKCTAILMHGDGETTLYEDGHIRSIKNEMVARGRGQQYAEGALAATADPEEAVEIAMWFAWRAADNVITVDNKAYACRFDWLMLKADRSGVLEGKSENPVKWGFATPSRDISVVPGPM